MKAPYGERLWRVAGIGVGWAAVWILTWILAVTIIGFADPDSIDPGEESFLLWSGIFGPMGFLSGIVFGLLLSVGRPGWTYTGLSLTRAAACGVLGSALAQIPYLGHGDQGLVANLKMAAMFAAFGGVIAIVWAAAAKAWIRKR